MGCARQYVAVWAVDLIHERTILSHVRHKVKVSPLRVHSYNAELACHTTRIAGYRWTCSCGARGKMRASVQAAREEGRTHRVVHAV
jgi:hypothetical protein